MTAYPETHWRQVAEVYREAMEAHTRPTLAVGSTWGINRSTAASWVRRARARGLIPPAAPGSIPAEWTCPRFVCPACGRPGRHV